MLQEWVPIFQLPRILTRSLFSKTPLVCWTMEKFQTSSMQKIRLRSWRPGHHLKFRRRSCSDSWSHRTRSAQDQLKQPADTAKQRYFHTLRNNAVGVQGCWSKRCRSLHEPVKQNKTWGIFEQQTAPRRVDAAADAYADDVATLFVWLHSIVSSLMSNLSYRLLRNLTWLYCFPRCLIRFIQFLTLPCLPEGLFSLTPDANESCSYFAMAFWQLVFWNDASCDSPIEHIGPLTSDDLCIHFDGFDLLQNNQN